MSGEWKPRLPMFCKCVICGEEITAPPFIASKPRRGSTIYAHTQCFTKEQQERKAVKDE